MAKIYLLVSRLPLPDPTNSRARAVPGTSQGLSGAWWHLARLGWGATIPTVTHLPRHTMGLVGVLATQVLSLSKHVGQAGASPALVLTLSQGPALQQCWSCLRVSWAHW